MMRMVLFFFFFSKFIITMMIQLLEAEISAPAEGMLAGYDSLQEACSSLQQVHLMLCWQLAWCRLLAEQICGSLLGSQL